MDDEQLMPIVSAYPNNPEIDGRQSDLAMQVRRGIIRGLEETQLAFVPEITLKTGRRADLMALGKKGEVIIFEIKSSVADFKSDSKWHEYKDYCDQFYFATHPQVPIEIFPESEGLVLADVHGCEIIRDASEAKLPPARRKAVTLGFARTAALRIRRMTLQLNSDDEES